MLLLVPLGSLVVITALEIASTAHRSDAVLDQVGLARAAIGPSGLVTTLQNELNWTMVELTGFEEQVALPVVGYEDTRGRTDAALSTFRLRIADAAPGVETALEHALGQLDALSGLRNDIDADPEPHDLGDVEFAQERWPTATTR